MRNGDLSEINFHCSTIHTCLFKRQVLKMRRISRRFYYESHACLETWRTRSRLGDPRVRSHSPEPSRRWLPWSVHCFLPDLPDSGTIPAMTHRTRFEIRQTRVLACATNSASSTRDLVSSCNCRISRRDHETPMITIQSTHTSRDSVSAPVE